MTNWRSTTLAWVVFVSTVAVVTVYLAGINTLCAVPLWALGGSAIGPLVYRAKRYEEMTR